jgi:putative protease
MNEMKSPELLAPAGSFESLHAALKAGANAVYFGVEQLNMRANSINSFEIKDMLEVTKLAKQYKAKTCLALNTVMYDHDMQLVRKIVEEAKNADVSAVIASDFSVMEICKSNKMPIHISTQANVSNIESVKFFAPFSDLIVMARELTLKQVEAITREIRRKNITGVSGKPLQIEIFAHGSLCMAISGKCYLSLHQQNASANRGACTQTCRRPYKVTDAETGEELMIENEYIMSPKDLCTIDILDQVIASGVNVLKIEGRGKSADYVYTVTKAYREAIDSVTDGTYTTEKVRQWKEGLSAVYNRGFWEGYYLGRRLGEWSDSPGSLAIEKKIFIGKHTKYYPRLGVSEFEVESGSVETGDLILVISSKFGIFKEKLLAMHVNGEAGTRADRKDKITFKMSERPSPGDKLYKILRADD